jgi:hypothetical protein
MSVARVPTTFTATMAAYLIFRRLGLLRIA